jgi:hypothetical protein
VKAHSERIMLSCGPCHYPKPSRFAIAAFRPERAVDISRWPRHRSRRPILRAPAGALDVNEFDEIVRDCATVSRPCRGAKAIMTGFPVAAAPANIRRASGAKLKRSG